MHVTRRGFLSQAVITPLAVLPGLATAAPARPEKIDISLAAWSLIGMFRAGQWKTLDLPKICREQFNINGVEFVNTLFEVPTYEYLQTLKRNLNTAGVQPVIIMIDQEGSTAHSEAVERKQAVIHHRKWIDIAHFLGCHGVRANVYGDKIAMASPDEMMRYAAESFTALCEYAAQEHMNVMIENHGGVSSDPSWLSALMKRVQLPNFGTLPDYGNFPDNIDYYAAIKQLLPYALGISVKSRMADGKFKYDVQTMTRMVHESGYRGFYGIESSPAHTGAADDFAAVRFILKELKSALNLG